MSKTVKQFRGMPFLYWDHMWERIDILLRPGNINNCKKMKPGNLGNSRQNQ
jgi:hypothetical protein